MKRTARWFILAGVLALGLAPASARAQAELRWRIESSTPVKNHVYLVRNPKDSGISVIVSVTVMQGEVSVGFSGENQDTVYEGTSQSFVVPPGKVLEVRCDNADHKPPAHGTYKVEPVK